MSGGVGNSRTFNESFDTENSQENGREDKAKVSVQQPSAPYIDKRTLEKLLESDSEDDEGSQQPLNHNQSMMAIDKKKKNRFSRLSILSKLNLLGLIDLALIACHLKLNKNMDDALRQCEESIIILKEFSKGQSSDIGIASQNLIEELLENLIYIKESDQELATADQMT